MSDDRPRRPTAPGGVPEERVRRPTAPLPVASDQGLRRPTAPAGVAVPGHTHRDPRVPLTVPVRHTFESFIHFVESQSLNISRSGMFLASPEPLPVGSVVEFEFHLADGFPLLKGSATVARVSTNPAGLGLRFKDMDESSRKLIDRIVEVNLREGRKPTVPFDFALPAAASDFENLKGASAVQPGIEFADRDLQIKITPATAVYFTQNPLLNIRLGGFVVPGPENIPLGVVFTVKLTSVDGQTLWSGKGKVVAKHESRLGVRLMEVDKPTLATLQSEIARVSGGSPGK